jgi:integrase/recombinase XerC
MLPYKHHTEQAVENFIITPQNFPCSPGTIAPSENAFLVTNEERDLVAELLADKRSVNTRRAYAKDLKDFFVTLTGLEPTPTLVSQFLGMQRFNAIGLVLRYKQHLIEKGLKEATINRRLAAVKSLVNYARKIGRCEWSLEDISAERVKAYRDTTGISPEVFKKMLAIPDRNTLIGLRNYAILRLLWDNALRRSEISQADIKDLDLESSTLWILGKGVGTSKEAVKLDPKTMKALLDWLQARQTINVNQPLFITLDSHTYGARLSGNAIYELTRAIANTAGISKIMSPHRVRHSSITAALEVSGGNVRKVQRLSRHAKLDTLMIYDDNRQNLQGEISGLLADLV